MGLHSRGTRGFTQERVDLHSRGFRQSWNAGVYTVAERVGLHSRGTHGFRQSERVGLDSRGTPGYTQSSGTRGFTVAERLGYTVAERSGFTQSRNAWDAFTVEERVDLHSRGTPG